MAELLKTFNFPLISGLQYTFSLELTLTSS